MTSTYSHGDDFIFKYRLSLKIDSHTQFNDTTHDSEIHLKP